MLLTPADRPLKELVSELGHDTGLLVRQEIALAKAELKQKVVRAAKGAATIGIAAFVAYTGVLAILAAVVLILIALGVVAWLAALIVGVVVVLAGYLLAQHGRRTLARSDAEERS